MEGAEAGGEDDGETGGEDDGDDPSKPLVWLDVTCDGWIAGRLIFELFYDTVPKTCENFRAIAAGDGPISSTGKPLTYKGNAFHRIIPEFVAQGGDITNGDGTGGDSIYGPTFPDENFTHTHCDMGNLSMANSKPNTNSSQFFITFGEQPHLDNVHVVFGKMVRGEAALELMKQAGTSGGTPKQKVVIEDCGTCSRSVLTEPEESAEKFELNAVSLANYVIETMNMPNAPRKIDQYMECFNNHELRVNDFTSGKLLYDSVDAFRDRWCEIFDASAGGGGGGGGEGGQQARPPLKTETTHRVFFQSSGIEAMAPSFCLDFWYYRHLCKPQASAGTGKGAFARRVTLYKAQNNKVVRMWTAKDSEGVGKQASATLDDVLITETFDHALSLARKHGASGELTPVYNNYLTDTVTIN